NAQAKLWKAIVEARLGADARRLDDVARPARHGVVAIEADVERASHITLRARREPRKFLHLRQRHRASGLLHPRSHDTYPARSFRPAEYARSWLTGPLTHVSASVQERITDAAALQHVLRR